MHDRTDAAAGALAPRLTEAFFVSVDGVSMNSSHRTFYVLAYDITDNRRRAKVVKLLEALGFRVQGSVFEGYINSQEIERLIRRLSLVIDRDSDSMRIYPLCESCRAKMTLIGVGKVNEPPDSVIII